jgi:lipopolysaccharide biosynthesis protein
LFITTTEQHVGEIGRRLSRHTISYEILVCENRGRDILPFLKAAQVLLRRGTDLILKLHTKRSLHRQDGDLWRQELVGKLVGNALEVIDAYNRNPNLGLVGPANNIQQLEFYWGANAASVDYLCHRVGIRSVDPTKEDFISGSMFWARLASLLPLLDADLSEFDFEGETGQIDGTLAHAVERIFGICAKDSGFMVCDSASIVKMS